jgi:hypothetical protein
MELGEAMMLARRRANLKQGVVAAAWGVSPQYVSMVELGRKPFPVERLDQLPRVLRDAVERVMIQVLEARISALRRNLEGST